MNFKIILLSFIYFIFFTSSIFAQINITGKVVDAKTNEPLAGVNIAAKGIEIGTVSDVNGNFTIAVSNNTTLAFSYIGFTTQEIVINNQTTLVVALVQNENFLQEVFVVGSRNSNRTQLDTPVPVDVIDVKNLQKVVPQYDLNQMLTYLAPSFQSNRQSSSDGTEHIEPASLRGLGPDQTLVLINGKRRHTTSLLNNQGTFGNGSVGTDLNAIPASAIERIEVLRDGAAAQYGSDAIAGVINIVLKKNTNQLNINANAGITSRGDGELGQINANYGFDLGKKGGFLNLTGEYYTRGRTNRTQNHDLIIFDQSQFGNFFAYPFTDDPALSRQIDDDIIAARGLTRDNFNFRVGEAQIKNSSFFYNLSLPFGDNNKGEFYSFAGIGYREGLGNGFRRLPSQTSNVNLTLFPNGFQPNTESVVWDRSVAVGVKYRLDAGWLVDLSNTFGNNRFDYRVTNTNNASLEASSPTEFKAGGHEFVQNTLNLDVSKYFSGIASGLNIAFGSEFRIDNYQIRAGEEASYRNYALVDDGDGTFSNPSGLAGASQSFPGYTPDNAINKSRTNLSFYADIEVDATEDWTISLSQRFENYSDFGSTLNSKFATRHSFGKAFAVRGAVSTGFRAPSLHQQYFSYVSTNLLASGELGQSGFFRNESNVAKALDIPKLKEETSTNVSLGFTVNPSNQFKVSVDAYYIKVKNRITLTGGFGQDPFGNPVPEIQALLVPFDAQVAQFFSNSINTSTRGIDLVATYTIPMGNNKLDISLLANINETTVDNDLNIPQVLADEGQEDVYFSPAEEGLIERVNPRQKVNLTLIYQTSKLNFLLRNTYFGEVGRDAFPFGVVQTFGGKLITDAAVSYQINKQLSLTVGANNLLDIFPDEQAYENSYFGVFKYAPVQMGFGGAFYFARVNFNLNTK